METHNFIINLFLFLAFFADILLWLFLSLKSNKNESVYICGLISLFAALWTLGILAFRLIDDKNWALFWNREFIFTSGLIASTFLHFAFSFTNRKLNNIHRFIIHTPNIFIIAGVFLKNAFIVDIISKSSGKESILGYAYPYFGAYWTIYALIATILLFQLFIQSKGLLKSQLIYIISASITTSSIGAFFNLYLILAGNYKYIWVGPYCSFFMVFILAYAITKHDLMDIRVAITRSVAYGFVGVLLVASFIALNSWHLPIAISIITNSALGLFWALAAHRLRAFIQTPLEEKWITGWYDPERLINAIAQKLAPVIDRNEALKIITEELKGIIKIKSVEIILENSGYDENNVSRTKDGVAIPLSSSNKLEAVLLLGQKISEDPYSEKDIALFKTISAMALPVFDRIYPYEQIKKELETTQIQLDRSQRLASLGTLAAGVAHEIRNPLGIIHSSAEEIVDKPGDLNYLIDRRDSITRQTKRISSIITNMLSLSKVKEKEIKPINLNDIVESTLQLFTINRIKLTKDLKQIPNINGDQDQLRQALINLINNAIEAMPEGGDLSVKTYQIEDKVCLEVSDTGRGISKENLEKIFDPFFSTRHEGAGLGLSIVYRIVREHGGNIEVKSEINKGSTFLIKLPVSKQ